MGNKANAGLSKKTNLQGDIAKKGATTTSRAPFVNLSKDNSRPLAAHQATHKSGAKGGVKGPYTDGSGPKGWK